MKKRLLLVLCIVTLLFCCALPASAADITVSVNEIDTAYRGETVTFTATLGNDLIVRSGSVVVSYDENTLEMLNTSTSGVWYLPDVGNGITLNSNFDHNTKTGGFAYSSAPGTTFSGPIFTVKFKVKDTAAYATTEVKLTVSLFDESNIPHPVVNKVGKITIKCSHSVTEQIATDEFFAEPATCNSPAKYYKSCKECGEKLKDTFYHGQKLQHSGGTATCTKQAICEKCFAPYGDLMPHSFVKEVVGDKYLLYPANCIDPAVYYKSCECGEKGKIDTFKSGAPADHSYTDENTSLVYLVTPASCTDSAVYVYSCKGCGAKDPAGSTFKAFGSAGHKFSNEWSGDKDNHWHECTACGEKQDLAPHVAGPAATEENPQTCTSCGYIITPALAHTHKFESTLSSNMSGHYYACTGCTEKKDLTSHVFDDPCDATCSVCGYERGVTHTYSVAWKTDGDKHWHECTNCKMKIDEGTHIAGPEATEDTAQRCKTCSYVIVPALNHEHSTSGDEMGHDDTHHWIDCDCGKEVNKEEHTWDDGVITVEPTERLEGEIIYTCTGCGATKTEAVSKLDSDIPSRTTVAITTVGNTENGGCGGCGTILGIGAIILIIIIVAIVVIVVKKREEKYYD